MIENCATCGFDFSQLGEVRRSAAAASAATPVRPSNSQQVDPLDRWLSGAAIEPKDPTDWERMICWIRRHPRWSGFAAALLAAAIVVPIVTLLAHARATDALQHISSEHTAAEEQCAMLTAAITQKDNALLHQETLLRQKAREQQDLEASLHELKQNYDRSQAECAAAEERLKEALRETRLSIAEDFSREAKALQEAMPEASLVLAAKALSITQQEGVAPIASAFQQVHELLAPTDGVELRGHEGPVAQLAASPDGNWLASGDHQGLVRLWNTTSAGELENPRLLDGHWGRITQLAFTADNRWLVSGSTDSTAHLWKLDSGARRMTPILLKNIQGRIATLATSEDGRWLVIASAGQLTNEVFVRLWDLRATAIHDHFVDLPNYHGQLCSLAISKTGEWIATGNNDGTVRLWRMNNATGAVSATDMRMHSGPVQALHFAPDGRSLIAAGGRQSGSGSVRAWTLDRNVATTDTVLADDSRGVGLFTMTSNGRWLFTATEAPSLEVRDLNVDRKPKTLLEGPSGAVQAMALSTNERWLATVGTENTVRLWYLGTTGPTATPITIRTPSGQITSIAFAGKGDWLATGNDRGVIRMWNLRVDDLIRMANARMLP